MGREKGRDGRVRSGERGKEGGEKKMIEMEVLPPQ